MICSKCGSQVQDGVAFCTKCGAPMSAGTSSNMGSQPTMTYGSSPVTSKSSNMNMVRVIASAIVIIATFMPYVSAFGFNQSLVDGGDGFIFMGLAAAVIVLDFIKKSKPAFVISIITLVFAVYEIIDTRKIASDAYGLLKYELGFYLLIIGAIAMVIAGPIMKAIKKN